MSPGSFRVRLTRTAIDDLAPIPEKPRRQIHAGLQSLATNPLLTGSGIKKLKGFKPPVYRLRAGDFRVLYRIEGDEVTVLGVIDRKELARAIKRLHL